MRQIQIVCACLILAGCLIPSSREVYLAEEGQALADIVIASNAEKCVRFAAEDLAWHLKEITGADFPILTDDHPQTRYEIRIGRTQRSRNTVEGFREQESLVDVSSEAIELIGIDKVDSGSGFPALDDAQGSAYAVWDFLETDLGVRWIDATDFGTIIPHDANLSVGFHSRRSQPFVLSRTGWGDRGYDTLLWGDGDEAAKRWHKLAYGNKSAKEAQDCQRRFLARQRVLGRRMGANHSFYSYYDFYWNTNAANFRAYHPEYFSKGRIINSRPAQLCYENEGLIQQVIADVRAYFDNPDPKTRRWGENVCCLEPMDNADFCTCEKCTKWYEPWRRNDHSTHSTYWFRFVNRVARALKQSHPDKRISTLAYWSHEGLPTGFEVEDNVTIWFCLFNNRMPFVEGYDRQLRRMAEWRAHDPNRPLAFWLYNTFPLEIARDGNFKTFPGFFSHECCRQFKEFYRLNAREGVFECGVNGTLESYMQLRLLRNPTLDAETLIGEYLSMFGAAAPAMRKFHDLCEKRYCDATIRPKGSHGASQHACWGAVGTPEVMKELAGYIAEAEALVDTPQAKGALALFKADIWDYMCAGAAEYHTRQSASCPELKAIQIEDAGGDPNKVNWARVPAIEGALFQRGCETRSKWNSSLRLAHDGHYLYLEFVLDLETKKLKPAAEIAHYDDIEIMFAREKSKPYRCWFLAPNGKFFAAAYGEKDESIAAATTNQVRYCCDITAPNQWVARLAFPLTSLSETTFAAGSRFYMNLFARLGPHLVGGWAGENFAFTSYTNVHVFDRMTAIKLEPKSTAKEKSK